MFLSLFSAEKTTIFESPFSGVGQKDWALDRGDFPSV
jgi:hypothetical protein